MVQTLIRWRLNEIMARHRVLAKELAEEMGISDNAISNLRRAETMPRIDGKRFNQLCASLTKLSKIHEPVTPYDLIEYLPNQEEKSLARERDASSAGLPLRARTLAVGGTP